MNSIPHASVCGGRARCSTCRVRIERGRRLAYRRRYSRRRDARQHRRAATTCGSPARSGPSARSTVTRLLRPASTGPQAADIAGARLRRRREAARRDVPRPARLHPAVAEPAALRRRVHPQRVLRRDRPAITTHGGWIDKFLGDGLLAIFGQHHGVEAGCRQALRAARAIDLALDHVNAKLESEIGRPLRVGMGIDAGPLLLGRIGYGEAVDLTVIGNAVNVASRLEALPRRRATRSCCRATSPATPAGSIETGRR